MGQSNTNDEGPTAREKRRMLKEEKVTRWRELEEEGAIVFNRQTGLALKLTTDGYAFGVEWGRSRTPKRSRLYWFEFAERKNLKEQKLTNYTIVNGYLVSGRPFIYGKTNTFFSMKLGYGQQQVIGFKGNKSGVGILGVYGGGLSFAFLKPYYLDVVDGNTNETKQIRYSDNNDLFLQSSSIIGYSGFGKGLNQLNVIPGIFIKGALRFDLGKYNDFLSCIEVGVNAEAYTSPAPIIAKVAPQQVFFNAYIGFLIGGRK